MEVAFCLGRPMTNLIEVIYSDAFFRNDMAYGSASDASQFLFMYVPRTGPKEGNFNVPPLQSRRFLSLLPRLV